MAGVQQTGILVLQPQEPGNVPTPPVESYYMFVNIFDGITYYKDSNRVCHSMAGISDVLPSGHILVGNNFNVASPVPVTGDVTLANNGYITVTAIRNVPVAAGPYATGTMLYFDGSVWQKLLPGINGQILTMVAGVPTWV